MVQADEDAQRQEITRLRAVEAELRARLAQAEEQLSASQALHAATIESLPFDFWARDRQGYCFSQNATTLANWGDLLHKRPEDMQMDRALVERWLDNNRRALSGETVVGDEEFVVGGEPRSIHNILAPIRMGEAIVGTLGVNIDITERKRTETALLDAVRALRESEAKLRLAVEAAGIGLWSADLGREEISWGPPNDVGPSASDRRTPQASGPTIGGVSSPAGAIASLHASGPGSGGMNPPAGAIAPLYAYVARVHPDDRSKVTRAIERGVDSGRWEVEYRILRGDGLLRWILGIGRLVREGERRLLVGADIDVTERHLRDERERQAQKLEAVGQLTAGIAHNFNNMLMGVLPYLELALVEAPPTIAPLLTEAQRSGQRAASLVRQLMTYAGRNRGNTRRVEAIRPIMERIVELCRSTFDKRVQLELSAPPSVSARVDAAQIEQVLLNLLLNARDALSDSGAAVPTISVTLDVIGAGAPELEGRAAEHLRVEVKDNGIGMDSLTVSRIFEPFFTTKGVGKGSGLGLATTHAIIREHEGWITCDSVGGRGTTFRFYLPSEAPAAAGSRELSPARAPQGSETVLVVDDEAVVRDVVARVLSSAGFRPLLASGGAEVLQLLADPKVASEVAVVLLDVSMPGMPRGEIRSRLRELAPRARVICFTGHAVEALDGDPVLEKPVSNEALLAKVRSVLDQQPGERG